MQVNGERMAAALAGDDSACATDLADFLVGRGLPFREAHHIVGKMIAYCRREGLRLKELNAGRRAAFHSALAEDVSAILDPLQVVEARRSRGGTATAAVREQLRLAEAALEVEWHKGEGQGEGQGDGSPVPPGEE
jgi:argininosuccinate lyase